MIRNLPENIKNFQVRLSEGKRRDQWARRLLKINGGSEWRSVELTGDGKAGQMSETAILRQQST